MRKSNSLLIILALTFSVPFAYTVRAQVENQRDSLLRAFQQAVSDSAKVMLLIETGKLYLLSNLDTARYRFQQAYDFAKSADKEREMARAKTMMGYIYIRRNDFDSAFQVYNEVIPVLEKYDLRRDLIVVYNNMGEAWNEKGNHWMAIDYFQKCRELIQQTDTPPHFPLAINSNLSLLYNDLRLFEKALEYGFASYAKAKEIEDKESMGIACINIANAYEELYREEEALTYFKEALDVAEEIDYQLLRITAQSNIADILTGRKQLTEARRLYEECLEWSNKNDYPYGQMSNYHGLSNIAFYQGDYGKAKRLAQQALKLGEQMNTVDFIFGTLMTLSDVALIEGDFDAWADYRKKYFLSRDSVANSSLAHAIQELETKYETERKERQIVQLEQAKAIDELKIRQKNGLIVGLAGLAVLLILAGSLGYRDLQNRRKIAEQEVKIQDQIIRELEQEKQLSALDAMLQGQEKERSRLARDLHDGLGGMLSGVQQTLFQMKGNQILPETSAAAFNQVIGNLDRSISELRHIARNMTPEALVRFGLKDALQDYCDYMRDSTGLNVHFQTFDMEERLQQHMEVVLFRIVQELLNNVAKHARAKQVLVQLLRDGTRIHLAVEDDGKGMDVAALEKSPGVGWVNIRSRVAYLGGTLDLDATPEQGTSVNIEFQLL